MAGSGGDLLVNAIEQRPTVPNFDVDAMFSGYTKLKELQQKQQQINEEINYHSGMLSAAAAQGGLKQVGPTDPGYEPGKTKYMADPMQLQQRVEAAKQEHVKSLAEAEKIGGGPLQRMFNPAAQAAHDQAMSLEGLDKIPGFGQTPGTGLQSGPGGYAAEKLIDLLQGGYRSERYVPNPNSVWAGGTATADRVNSQGSIPSKSKAPKGAKGWDTVNRRWV